MRSNEENAAGTFSILLVESVTVTNARHKDTSDKRQEETTCRVNGVVD